MQHFSPSNPKPQIGSLRQYFNSRKLDSSKPSNPSTPNRLSPYLQKQVAYPTPKNPFFDSSEPSKKLNLIERNVHTKAFPVHGTYTRNHQAKPNTNLFYNNPGSKEIKDSAHLGYNQYQKRVSPGYQGDAVNQRPGEYVVNNFVNIQNVNIKNFYRDRQDDGSGLTQKSKDGVD